MLHIFSLLAALVLFAQVASADNTGPFFDLIEIKRDADGQLYEVIIRPDLPLKPVEIIQEEMLESMAKQQQLGVMYNPIPMSDKKLPGEREFNEYRKIVQKILRKLRSLDLEDIFSNSFLKRFLKEFQERVAESSRDFQVIARPNDPNYFHSNNVMKEILKRGMEDAMENFPGTVAGIVSYIISETIRVLIDRRTYYQNFVAHYLLNYSPRDLGLTSQEVDWIKSSIYESKIAWDKPWESWDIEEQWDTYGIEKYNEMALESLVNWEREKIRFETFGEFYNLSFIPVIESGVLKVKNVLNLKNKYSKRLSTAFNYKKPCKQIGYRFIMRLIEMGIYQIPIHDLLKKPFRKYIHSLYGPQTLQEGFLAGYMMSNNMPEVKYIFIQSLNPLIISDHKWDKWGQNRYDGLSCR